MTYLFLLLFAGVLIALEVYSKRNFGKGLNARLTLGSAAAEPDEPFSVCLETENRRPLPVLFVRLSLPVPLELALKTEGTPVRIREQRLLESLVGKSAEETLYLMPRQKFSRRLQASLPARGRYVFTSLSLTTGDFLGLEEDIRKIPIFEEIVIYPKRDDCPALTDAFGNYLGDVSVRRFILSDPILTVGFREYTGREPMKDISWPRSLRDGTLMVKEYDHTAELNVMVILNIDNADIQTAEKCFSVTRSGCEWLENNRVRYSFLSNANTGSAAGSWSFLPDGLGAQHLGALLEGLGRAPLPGVRCRAEELFRDVLKHNDRCKGYVLITPALGERELGALRALESTAGQKVLTVTVDREGVCS